MRYNHIIIFSQLAAVDNYYLLKNGFMSEKRPNNNNRKMRNNKDNTNISDHPWTPHIYRRTEDSKISLKNTVTTKLHCTAIKPRLTKSLIYSASFCLTLTGQMFFFPFIALLLGGRRWQLTFLRGEEVLFCLSACT